ncbi:MAG: thiamine pyrophosphate-binding protein [Thermomicrobiales bacterium]
MASVSSFGAGPVNTTAALSTAYATNTPVLAISGQINSDMIDKGYGQLHEIPNQLQMIASVTKWAARIDSRRKRRAWFARLQADEHRPTASGRAEMAPDIMGLMADVELLDPITNYDRPAGDPDKLEEAAKLLGNAKKPMIFAGTGVLGAGEELLALAEMLQAPIIASSGGKGVVADDHYLLPDVNGSLRSLDGDRLRAGRRHASTRRSPVGESTTSSRRFTSTSTPRNRTPPRTEYRYRRRREGSSGRSRRPHQQAQHVPRVAQGRAGSA